MQTGEEPDGSEDGGQKDQRKEETKSKPKRAAPDMCGGAVVFRAMWRNEVGSFPVVAARHVAFLLLHLFLSCLLHLPAGMFLIKRKTWQSVKWLQKLLEEW